MSYTPTEWSNGDVITAEKLNKLENGVADCGESSSELLMVHITQTIEYDSEMEQDVIIYEYDKTGAEILEALQSHKSVIFHETFSGSHTESWYYPTSLEPNGADEIITNWKLQIGRFSYSTRAYTMGFTIYEIFIDDGEITFTTPYNALV